MKEKLGKEISEIKKAGGEARARRYVITGMITLDIVVVVR
jgi:hypothetical protein